MSNDSLITTLQTLYDEYAQKQKAANNLLKTLKGKSSALGKVQQALGDYAATRSNANLVLPKPLFDLYGTALYDLLRDTNNVHDTTQLGLCLLCSDHPSHLALGWSTQDIERYLADNYRRMEKLMDLGAYHHLLPTALKKQSVIDQFEVNRFQSAIEQLSLITLQRNEDGSNADDIVQFQQFAGEFDIS